MMHPSFRLQLGSVVIAALVVTAMPLAARGVPERFELGQNSAGESCSAARNWVDDGAPFKLSGDQSFTITCRGISAAEEQGYVSAVNAEVPVGNCGEFREIQMARVGLVQVRRCFDARLARNAVDIRFTLNGRKYQGAALELSQAPLEMALRVVSGRVASAKPGIAAVKPMVISAVPDGPKVEGTSQGGSATADAILGEALAAIHSGRSLDASRLLNDAIREFASAPEEKRVDLRIAAGLADSNLSQFQSAANHFAVADGILAKSPKMADVDFKRSLLLTYRGLDLINQRKWQEAVNILKTKADASLEDPATLSRLNEEANSRGETLSSSLADASQLARRLLAVQQNWALSVAYLGEGEVKASAKALDEAVAAAEGPVRLIAPERIVWMRASIERQNGRIQARNQDYAGARLSFDCAIAALSGESAPAGCRLRDGPRLPDTAINAPLLVETKLERASIAASDPAAAARPEAVLAEYDEALKALPNLSGTGTVALGALEGYFALLTRAPQTDRRDEAYFGAMQMIGEPGIAREYAQLQKILSSDPNVAVDLRRRGDLERQLIRLRYEIGGAKGAQDAGGASPEALRADINRELDAINNRLLKANGIGALQDQPATIEELRKQLAPGEVYLKVVALRTRMFAIVIAPEGKNYIYQVGDSMGQIDAQVQEILASVQLEQVVKTDKAGNQVTVNRTKLFALDSASKLFTALAGSAVSELTKANRMIVYNPAGSLRQLPISILVTNAATVERFNARKPRNGFKFDYSDVSFLGSNSETFTVLSPRAFLRSRTAIRSTKATEPFLGLGENAVPEQAAAAVADRPMPFDCKVSYAAWAAQNAERAPVSADEIAVAAYNLGVKNPGEVIRGAFTDLNLLKGEASRRLANYQVLHFATHGLPETAVTVDADQPDECHMHLPPSLVTTLAAPDADGKMESDGLLSSYEVAQLRLDANLVVLSACDTAAGASVEIGRLGGVEDSMPSLDGLVRSFIAANARSVMATYWKVPEGKQTNDLLGAFYFSGRSASISRSLQVAQAKLIAQPRYSHPYYWGAYFVVGDGSKNMLTQ